MGGVARRFGIPLVIVIGALFILRVWSPFPVIQNWSQFATAPLIFIVRTPISFIGDRLGRFGALWNAEANNEKLEEKLQELRARVFFLEGVEKENSRLRQALGFTTRPFILETLVSADVTLRHPGTWFHFVEINKGQKHGVQPGMVALTPEGVVGHVEQVHNGTSRIRMITDLQSAIPSSGDRTKELGLLVGTGTNTLHWQYIPADSDIQEGDLIGTAGASAIYPEGLKLGYVTRGESKPGEIFKVVHVRPAVNMATLQSVFLVQSR